MGLLGQQRSKAIGLLGVALKLGVTSFGGPIAHLGYFHAEYVVRRGWIDESTYAELVALSQLLPGPASSKLGIAIGIRRAGLLGGLFAWIGFTLPSAALMWGFALALHALPVGDFGWFNGLLAAAVAIVAQAVWNMATRFANGPKSGSVALAAAAIVTLLPGSFAQVGAIVAAGVFGSVFLAGKSAGELPSSFDGIVHRTTGLVALVLFAALLVALPVVASLSSNRWISMAAGFYRTGALVFGGGHIVLPLLHQVVIPPGWMTDTRFLAGYSAAQVVPGPLFTFATFLGASTFPRSLGIPGGLVATVAIFLPGFLLTAGALPFWSIVRERARMRAAIAGVNAAVVGLLLAALYNPVWINAIHAPVDFVVAVGAFGLLTFWKAPPWIVVAGCAAVGVAISTVHYLHGVV